MEISGRFPTRALDFSLLQLRRDGTDHTGRHLILKVKKIRNVPLEAIGPDVGPRSCIDQLPGNPQAFARPANTSLEDIADAQLAADLLDVDSLALVGEARIAGDYEERFGSAKAP